MQTAEQLEDALRNAHAAGDTAAAQKLADALASQRLPTVSDDQIKGNIATHPLTSNQGSQFEEIGNRARVWGGQFVTKDDQARADIIRKVYPDAQFAQAENGDWLAKVNDEHDWARLKTPGSDVVNDMIRFIPAAKLGSLGGGLLSRIGLAGAGGVATAAASEKAAEGLGSEQEFDTQRLAEEGGAMVVGEAVGPALIGGGRSILRNLPGRKKPLERAVEQVAKIDGRRAVDSVGPLPGANAADVHIDPQSLPGGVVYHTTTRANLDRIMKEGISNAPENRTFGSTEPEFSFLSSKDGAKFWRQRIGERTGAQGDELVTIEIPADDLEAGRLLMDREGAAFGGNRASDLSTGTFQYAGAIGPDALARARIVSPDEIATLPNADPLKTSRGRAQRIDRARMEGGEVDGGVRALPSQGEGIKRLKNAEAAAIGRVARDLEIPLTQGQLTRDAGQLRFEEMATGGGRGPFAQQVMRKFEGTQEEAVKRAFNRKLNPNPVAVDMDEAGRVVRDTLRTGDEAMNRSANQAFKRLEQVDASLPGGRVVGLAQEMRNAVPKGLREPGAFVTNSSVKENFAESSRILSDVEAAVEKFAQNPNQPVNFSELMTLRGSISLAQKGATRGDRAALPAMKQALDDFVIREATENLAAGKDIAELFKDAPRAKALWGGLYTKRGKDDIAGGVIRQIVDQDLSGEKVANILVGGAGSAGDRTTYTVAKRMKDIAATNAGMRGKKINPAQLAEKAPEFQALRDAMMHNIGRKGFGMTGDKFAPGAMATHMDKLLDGPGKEVMQELFTGEELLKMRNYRTVLRQMDKDKTHNWSNTAVTAAANNFLGILGKVPGTAIATNVRHGLHARKSAQGVTENLPQGVFATSAKNIGAAYTINDEARTRAIDMVDAKRPKFF